MSRHTHDSREIDILARHPITKKPSMGLRCLSALGHPVNFEGVLKNRSVFLAGGGPSLSTIDLSLLSRRGVISMAMNNAWSIFRPTYWVCVDEPHRFCEKGWEDPGIIKFCPAAHRNNMLRRRQGQKLRKVTLRPMDCPNTYFFCRGEHFDPERYIKEPEVCWGNPSDKADACGHQGARTVMLAAIKLLYWMGAKDIYLIGTDFRMSEDHKYAFPQDRPPASIQNNRNTYAAMLDRFEALKPHLRKAGLGLHCCVADSPLSAVLGYREYAEAIEDASGRFQGDFQTEGWYG